MTEIYVLDTETTGVTNHPVQGHPQVIELAHIPLEQTLSNFTEFIKEEIKDLKTLKTTVERFKDSGNCKRYKPSMQIHKRAREVHGIWMKDLLKEEKSEDLKLPSMTYMVGHNIQYDFRCLGKPEDIKLICTLKLARQIDKKFGVGFKNHKQDSLLIEFYGEKIEYLVTGHHEALYDCVKCILLLAKLLEYIPGITTFDELYEFQQALSKK